VWRPEEDLQEVSPRMDRYLSTIVKQSAVLGAAIGIVLALVYGLMQYSKLQYALFGSP
jgi:hypothetical protein